MLLTSTYSSTCFIKLLMIKIWFLPKKLNRDISAIKIKILPLKEWVSELEEKCSDQKTFITLLKHGAVSKRTEEEQIK